MNRNNPKSTWWIFASRRMLVAFIMGFSCGLPLLLTMGVWQARMAEKGIDLGLISLLILVQLPYNCKFLWAPFLDRYIPPFLGRRRGWLIIAQTALVLSIAALGFFDPRHHFRAMVMAACFVAFFSATQDTIVDAYRREDLPDLELGLGASLYINGYRLGTLLASGGGLILADHIPWSIVHLVMCAAMLPAILTTLLTPEPYIESEPPKTLKTAVIEPLKDYFKRSSAWSVLAFIVIFKIGDTMASALSIPFYMEMGFSKTEIGLVVKFFGTGAIVAGLLMGGLILLRLGINRSLWIFGFLQAVSTACFVLLARIGYSPELLAFVIAFENLSSGMGTSAFVAFMASITNKRFTATQYAFLSGLMAAPRVLAAAPTGLLPGLMGWDGFFIFCTLAAVPGMLLLSRIAPWRP